MFTHKDIATRTIIVVDALSAHRSLRVQGGELLLEETVEGADGEKKKKTLTKFPFQKILALFVIGPVTMTTPLLDKCKRYGVAFITMKGNLRPVFYWADTAEANFLLRHLQHTRPADDLTIARSIVRNKIINQQAALRKTRRRDEAVTRAIEQCDAALAAVEALPPDADVNNLMAIEGHAASAYFKAYFADADWHGRHPRMKTDPLNVTLDIGYTILFNFVECFLRLYGFDLYVGVYHRTWYKRKSLVCDLVEPFRCLVDHAVLLAYHRKTFSEKDFTRRGGEYFLKNERCGAYYRLFFEELIKHKQDVFRYVQAYYRRFMGRRSVAEYPQYLF